MSRTAFTPIEPLVLALSLGHAATAGAEVAAATDVVKPGDLLKAEAREPRELHRSLRNPGSRSPNSSLVPLDPPRNPTGCTAGSGSVETSPEPSVARGDADCRVGSDQLMGRSS
ncbi:hypothetical protein EDB85DRAFT_1970255, partial [Lactarius pseudohatsudake]